MTEKGVKKGQYWVDNEGSVVLITGQSADETFWTGKRIGSSGMERVDVTENMLVGEIDPVVALKFTMTFLEKKIKKFWEIP